MSVKTAAETYAETYGWQEDWRNKLALAQEIVVHALQRKLIDEATKMTIGNSRSGEIKDVSVALGIAVDKLEILRAL